MPADYAALEAARVARGGRDTTAHVHDPNPVQAKKQLRFVRQDFAVAKVYDDGRPATVIRFNLSAIDAEAHAGRLRDTMTDADVGLAESEGWNYKVITTRGNQSKKAPPYAAGRGIGAMSAEKRREISRKANAARWAK